MVEHLSLNFRVFTVKFVGVLKFKNFTKLRESNLPLFGKQRL